MFRLIPTLVVVLALLLNTGCKKDENNAVVDPTISLLSDSGYTWHNDTVGPQDTIRVGVKVSEGSLDLRSFKVAVHYDGEALGHLIDSIPYTGAPFVYTRQLIMRDQAGSERYAFSVLDANSNVVGRSITITVQ